MVPLLVCCLIAFSGADLAKTEILEDGRLNFTEFTAKYGHPSEEYDVQTEDGYILTVFRIKGNEGNPPVLCMHGLLDSADSFIIRGNNSTAMALSAAGYDVWVGNCRGNKYAKRHVTFSSEKHNQQFWNFTFHEMAVYDLTATIDFILAKTGREKLSVIGHSQGTTLVLGSERPEYNDKVSLFIALGPSAYQNHLGEAQDLAMIVWPAVNAFCKSIGLEEVFRTGGPSDEVIQHFCTKGHGYDFCWRKILEALVGYDPGQIESEFFNVAICHFPAGASRKDLDHWAQLRTNDRFARYDYGDKNEEYYPNSYTYTNGKKVSAPPEYNLRNVTMPVALISGGADLTAPVYVIERLNAGLGNVVFHHIIERFSHADLVWAQDLQVYLNPLLEELLTIYA